MSAAALANGAIPRPAVARQSLLATTLLKRRDIDSLAADADLLLLFRLGIEWMMAKARQDPTHPFSWTFQANIHGRPKFPPELVALGLDQNANAQYRVFADKLDFTPAIPVYESCPHGNWWFLPWHRAYLHYFERIMRFAAEQSIAERKASGEFTADRAAALTGRLPDLALPYWNYVKTERRTLPEVFREAPAGAWNPLFLPDRAQYVDAAGAAQAFPVRSHGMNVAEAELSGGITVLSALNKINFTTSSMIVGDSFGGARSNTVAGDAGDRGFGTLEQIPHNKVHTVVGGDKVGVGGEARSGLMGDVPTAARDPIFWLHHCEIDRLGVIWLKMGGGRAFTTDPLWHNQEFKFYDVGGDQQPVAVTIKVSDLLTTEGLGYEYDDLPLPDVSHAPQLFAAPLNVAAAAISGETQFREIAASQADRAPAVKAAFVENVQVAVDLTRAEARVALTTVPNLPAAFAAQANRRFILALEGIGFTTTPGVNYEIYLLPKTQRELPADAAKRLDYRAGSLTFFGLHQHGAAADHHAAGGHPAPSLKFDVTETVRRLEEKYQATLAELGLSVVLVSETGAVPRPTAKQGTEAAEARADVVYASVRSFRLLGAE